MDDADAHPSTRFLNLGCGSRYLPSWTNLDVRPRGPEVLAHDLRMALPFDQSAFAVVYSSHVLEHLGRTEAERLVRECVRVLEPGGVLRVVVPDLERLARLYLRSLEQTEAGTADESRVRQWHRFNLDVDESGRVYKPESFFMEGTKP